MRKLILVVLLGSAVLSGCVVEPIGPSPYYYHHHCGYYHCW
jgi:hypothetical protein